MVRPASGRRRCVIATLSALSLFCVAGPLRTRVSSRINRVTARAFVGGALGVAEREDGVSTSGAQGEVEIDTLIFDIDDTLYPVSNGFSEHRMGEVTRDFMVEHLDFESPEAAMKLWREYIERYHSTMKALTVAMEEGRLSKPFVKEDLANYWAENCRYSEYIDPDPAIVEVIKSLREEAGLKLVAFTNAPRKYALRCLEALGLKDYFDDKHVFAVEDVLPACKPEKAAFDKVLSSVGSKPERTIMFEDSMKNVRACSALGMQTVLIHEGSGGEASFIGDTVDPEDPTVGAVLESVGDARAILPELWQGRFLVRES